MSKHYSEVESRKSERLLGKITEARNYYFAGIVLSILGFSLPWFKFEVNAQWWYGGWRLMEYEGLSWIVMIYVGYGMLVLTGALLHKQDDFVVKMAVILSLIVILATFIIVSVAMADAVEGVRTLDRLVWNVGLVVMLPGHALMLWGAFAVWVYQTMNASLGDDA